MLVNLKMMRFFFLRGTKSRYLAGRRVIPDSFLAMTMVDSSYTNNLGCGQGPPLDLLEI